MLSTGKNAPKKLERVVDRLRFGLRNRLEKRVTVTDGQRRFEFGCANRSEVFRAKTLLSKEPGTCDWLRNNLKRGDVFYDVGANIGLYSVFAGRLGLEDLRVVAFEPHAENFSRLCRNIQLNRLSDVILPISAALNDQDGWFSFSYSSWEAASSASQLGDLIGGRPPQFRELKVGCTLDNLVEGGWLPAPNVVKMDVDGREPNIVRGMTRLLSRPERPRGMQIEIQKGDSGGVIPLMQTLGYVLRGTHLTAGGARKLARGRSMNEIAYNAVFEPSGNA